MTTQEMQSVLDSYFEAWKEQDTERLISLFNTDGVYKVKPFGIEEYRGTESIRRYWEANPVSSQISPMPEQLRVGFGEDVCFAEWETAFETTTGMQKIVRGILLLEFRDELIQELREHYSSIEQSQ